MQNGCTACVGSLVESRGAGCEGTLVKSGDAGCASTLWWSVVVLDVQVLCGGEWWRWCAGTVWWRVVVLGVQVLYGGEWWHWVCGYSMVESGGAK